MPSRMKHEGGHRVRRRHSPPAPQAAIFENMSLARAEPAFVRAEQVGEIAARDGG